MFQNFLTRHQSQRSKVHIAACTVIILMVDENVANDPGLPDRVTLYAGVTICHVNVPRWGNPPSRGRVHGIKLKS